MDEQEFYHQRTLPSFQEKESEQQLPLPGKIGPYKIEMLLSKGSTSLLYLGIDPETKKPLVLKVLSPQFVNHPEMVEHFLWEAKIIALTNHPNIVKLYGQGQWENGLYITMEFIRGVSLRQFIAQQSFSLKRSIEIILQVAYALCHLHTHGVIHRDLKPENILIAEDGEVKVIDFGIAQLHEDFESKKSPFGNRVAGTPNYMSPEQKEDPLNTTFASDIYALGVITYELILGKLSYGIINVSLLPKGIQKIVEKAIAVSVQERYHDIVDFISDLSNYLKSEEMEKEKTSSDQMKELFETIQQTQMSLSPIQVPHWPQLEIGIAKHRAYHEMGFYYDFFKFANNTYGILMAQSLSDPIANSIYIAILRGMIQMQLHEFLIEPKKAFEMKHFMQILNQLIVEDRLKGKFSLAFLILDPLRDSLSYTACGFGPLLHIPRGSHKVRTIASNHPPIGTNLTTVFAESGDNWNEGDVLILHTLKGDELQKNLMEIALDSTLFSPQRAAESLIKKLTLIPTFEFQKYLKAILTISRIA